MLCSFMKNGPNCFTYVTEQIPLEIREFKLR